VAVFDISLGNSKSFLQPSACSNFGYGDLVYSQSDSTSSKLSLVAWTCWIFYNMPVVNPEKLIALQRNADEVRNVCSNFFQNISNTNELLDLYSGSRRKQRPMNPCNTRILNCEVGSWQNLSHGRSHRYKRHHLPQTCRQDPLPRFSPR